MASPDEPAQDLHEYGKVLADVDDRINRALHDTDGDELAAEELLRKEDDGAASPTC